MQYLAWPLIGAFRKKTSLHLYQNDTLRFASLNAYNILSLVFKNFISKLKAHS